MWRDVGFYMQMCFCVFAGECTETVLRRCREGYGQALVIWGLFFHPELIFLNNHYQATGTMVLQEFKLNVSLLLRRVMEVKNQGKYNNFCTQQMCRFHKRLQVRKHRYLFHETAHIEVLDSNSSLSVASRRLPFSFSLPVLPSSSSSALLSRVSLPLLSLLLFSGF